MQIVLHNLKNILPSFKMNLFPVNRLPMATIVDIFYQAERYLISLKLIEYSDMKNTFYALKVLFFQLISGVGPWKLYLYEQNDHTTRKMRWLRTAYFIGCVVCTVMGSVASRYEKIIAKKLHN